ncbi:MAG: hybrid sensor histidine kinase/response regulator [Deltaproteobacteria bacterium]|nr:hybrid sensor histidine kinase/response regulator [Deltaproteobacteria bacterium]
MNRPIVLYVDDEKANRIVFEQSLASDFQILTAPDGPTALQMLEQQEVAVVVTDMRMPHMNGEDLLRVVKERWPHIIRIVVTAYSDIDPILRAINEGLVARYILKPWVRAELVQVLRWAIEASALGRDSAEVHRRLLETERLATLGSISALLVHDLRQPLAAIIGNIELLDALKELAPTLREALRHVELDARTRKSATARLDELGSILGDMRTASELLSTMIGNLRDLSRPRDASETGVVADPMQVVRHAMSVCQPLAINLHAQIDYHGPRQLPRVRMSPTELTQVLINVVTNGAQAVAARGGEQGHVHIAARETGGMVELQVRDDGVGIPPDVLARIGTPFFTTRSEGTGLGVAQCQRLVGTAGGRFRIESEPGKGTIVTITLPTAA